jgi:hypothetical protein
MAILLWVTGDPRAISIAIYLIYSQEMNEISEACSTGQSSWKLVLGAMDKLGNYVQRITR